MFPNCQQKKATHPKKDRTFNPSVSIYSLHSNMNNKHIKVNFCFSSFKGFFKFPQKFVFVFSAGTELYIKIRGLSSVMKNTSFMDNIQFGQAEVIE
jgi:hypothetical protein